MMITVNWGDSDQTFVMMTIDGTWTTRQFIDAISQVNRYVASKPYTVQLVVDLQQAGMMPPGLLTSVPHLISQRPINADKAFIISPNPVWRNFWNMLSQATKILHKESFIFVSDEDDLHPLLQKHTVALQDEIDHAS